MGLTISEIKSLAKRGLKGKWSLAVQLSLLVLILTVFVPNVIKILFIGGISNWINGRSASPYSDLFNFLYSLALIPFSISIYWFFLNLIRFENPKISQVFEVYKNSKISWKLISANILVGILTFLWTLLFIIPGIIKGLAYSQTFFIMRDHPEYSIIEAISESRKRMNGYKWKYFLMNLSFIGWAFLCLLTLGIGLLWLVPYISAAQATFYNELIFTKDEIQEEEESM